MFKRILIPTDGSPIARKGIKTGVALAKALGASVVGYYAVEPIEQLYYSLGESARAGKVEAIEKRLRDLGMQYVDQIRKAATAAGVAAEVVMTSSSDPFHGIVEAARKQRCDVICMASHGRGQVVSALLGNVTQKVLAHSDIPVLVCR